MKGIHTLDGVVQAEFPDCEAKRKSMLASGNAFASSSNSKAGTSEITAILRTGATSSSAGVTTGSNAPPIWKLSNSAR